jgi:hypothetical protein
LNTMDATDGISAPEATRTTLMYICTYPRAGSDEVQPCRSSRLAPSLDQDGAAKSTLATSSAPSRPIAAPSRTKVNQWRTAIS